MQNGPVLKKWILTYWPHPQDRRGSAGKIFATRLLHSQFPLIWYATCLRLKKLNFDLLTPFPRVYGEGQRAKCLLLCCCILLHFVIPFNLICNMTIFWKMCILTFWPNPRVGVCVRARARVSVCVCWESTGNIYLRNKETQQKLRVTESIQYDASF